MALSGLLPSRRALRLALGIALIAVGLPVFVTPLPFGLLLIAPGLALTTSASATARRLLARLTRRIPALRRLDARRTKKAPGPARTGPGAHKR